MARVRKRTCLIGLLWLSVCLVAIHSMLSLRRLYVVPVLPAQEAAVARNVADRVSTRVVQHHRLIRESEPVKVDDSVWKTSSPINVTEQTAGKAPENASSATSPLAPTLAVPVLASHPALGRRPLSPTDYSTYEFHPNTGLRVSEKSSDRILPRVDAEIVVLVPSAPRLLKTTGTNTLMGYYVHSGAVAGFVLETMPCVWRSRRFCGRWLVDGVCGVLLQPGYFATRYGHTLF